MSLIPSKCPSEVINAIFALHSVSHLKCHAVTSQSVHPMWNLAPSSLNPSVCLTLVSPCFQLARLYPAPSSDVVPRAGALAWKKEMMWYLARRSVTPLREMLSFPGLALPHWTLCLSLQPAHSGYFPLNLCPVLVTGHDALPSLSPTTQIPHRVSVIFFPERSQLLCTAVDRSGGKKEMQGIVRV